MKYKWRCPGDLWAVAEWAAEMAEQARIDGFEVKLVDEKIRSGRRKTTTKVERDNE